MGRADLEECLPVVHGQPTLRQEVMQHGSLRRRSSRRTETVEAVTKVQPALHGDLYSYSVDKFWRVIGVRHDNTLVVLTRKGKQHTIAATDPNLRRAHWWERLLFGHRFPPRKNVE